MNKANFDSALANVIRMSAYGMSAVGILSFFVNLLLLVSPLYMQQVYDRVLTTHHLDTLIYLSVFTVICLIFLALFDGGRTYVLTRIGRWWDETLRVEVLHAAMYQSRVAGRLATSALSDLQAVRSFVGSANVLPFFDAPWMPAFLLLIALIHPVLGLIGLFGAIVLFILAVANDIATRKAVVSIGERSIRLNAFTATAMRHADVIHAMGMFKSVGQNYEKMGNEITAVTQVAGDRAAIIGAVTKAVRIGVQVAVLGIGAYYVTVNELTGGGMIAASIILGRALAPVEQGLGAWKAFISARAAHRRLSTLVGATPPTDQAISLPAPSGRVTVENLVFALPGLDRPILRNINFTLEPGSMLALVGPSASGKSTFCRLLVGSWSPTAGHIRLDGADIGRWDRNEIGAHLGYMPQSVELFGGTIRDNIARLGDATDEEVIAAAVVSGCHELILRLPKGYETNIGEAGSYLSGGQRQRIALARAVLRKPRLLVLDEPNSNLDSEGEARLAAALQEMKKSGSTIVLVSHRMSLFGLVDYIAVMREGQLEKFGPRDQVLRELQPQTRAQPQRAPAPAPAASTPITGQAAE
jgi:PrtD family type I secretion system ABC transporter